MDGNRRRLRDRGATGPPRWEHRRPRALRPPRPPGAVPDRCPPSPPAFGLGHFVVTHASGFHPSPTPPGSLCRSHFPFAQPLERTWPPQTRRPHIQQPNRRRDGELSDGHSTKRPSGPHSSDPTEPPQLEALPREAIKETE